MLMLNVTQWRHITAKTSVIIDNDNENKFIAKVEQQLH